MSEVIVKGTRIVAGLVLAGGGLLTAMNTWEGDGSVVYADKLAGGLPTVCAGHTDWSLRVGTPYTKEECARIDGANAEKYGMAIIRCTGHGTEGGPRLNQNQFDALTLFAINVGATGACSSRAARLMKQSRADEACDAIAHGPDGTPVWSYVGGGTRFVRGLYNRRLFERDWCLRPVPNPEGAA